MKWLHITKQVNGRSVDSNGNHGDRYSGLKDHNIHPIKDHTSGVSNSFSFSEQSATRHLILLVKDITCILHHVPYITGQMTVFFDEFTPNCEHNICITG